MSRDELWSCPNGFPKPWKTLDGRENGRQKSKYRSRRPEWHRDILLLLPTLILIFLDILLQDLSSPGAGFMLVIVPELDRRVSLPSENKLTIYGTASKLEFLLPATVSMQRVGFANQYAVSGTQTWFSINLI